jgi:hypothetical protein
MDSGWVAAIASIASAFIVAVTAIAAFRQLKHNRNANDIVVYLRLIDRLDSAETQEARAAIAIFAEKVNNDRVYREALRDPKNRPEEFRRIAELLGYLEHISVLIIRGGVAESLVLAEYADTFVSIWEQTRPAILERRHAFGPHISRAFEHLAMRSKHYIESGQMEREYAALESDQTVLRLQDT